MLMTLKHLLLTVVVFAAGLLASAPLARSRVLPEPLPVLCVLGGGALAVLVLSWPLYRLLHLRPLGLPYCPHCGNQHGNYHCPADAWPSGILVCDICQKPTLYHMSRKRPPDPRPDMPNLYLYWPEFLGRWRLAQDPPKRA
jgi:hypothetical protein